MSIFSILNLSPLDIQILVSLDVYLVGRGVEVGVEEVFRLR